MNQDLPVIYLASGSPRRRELLQQIAIRFDTLTTQVDETPHSGESAAHYVERLARAKALAGWQCPHCQQQPRPVLGADTSVVIDGEVLGKPEDDQQAARMLRRLSGRTHQVLTGVALCWQGECTSSVVLTEVTFRDISEQTIQDYLASGEPADKAGSYGIQGLGGSFVTRINGSYPAVVGLPLAETELLLRALCSQHQKSLRERRQNQHQGGH